MSKKSKYESLRREVESYGAQLVAVSKTKPITDILALYEQGQRDFGENRVQELSDKRDQLPSDIRWHQIGHLQRNKVKHLLPDVALIHAVDSQRLLNAIGRQADKLQQPASILFQLKIAQEDSKYGFSYEELERLLAEMDWSAHPHLRCCGLMGMATFTDDSQQVRREFVTLRQYFETLKQQYFAEADSFNECSMGMSGDYRIALDAGSTMVRIGSLLFGAR